MFVDVPRCLWSEIAASGGPDWRWQHSSGAAGAAGQRSLHLAGPTGGGSTGQVQPVQLVRDRCVWRDPTGGGSTRQLQPVPVIRANTFHPCVYLVQHHPFTFRNNCNIFFDLRCKKLEKKNTILFICLCYHER